MASRVHYSKLADVFRYPTAEHVARLEACRAALSNHYPEAAQEIGKVSEYMRDLDLREHQELFVKTFDVQALCYLDLGFVIFGEDYKRGMFLVHMKQEQERAGHECGEELPDHLSNVLVLLDKTPDAEFRDDLVGGIVLPAVRKMLEGFDSARVRDRMRLLKKRHHAVLQEDLNYGNVYQFALRALLLVLESDFADLEFDAGAVEASPSPCSPNAGCFAPSPGSSCSLPSARHGG